MHGKLVRKVGCCPASRACHKSEIIIRATVLRPPIIEEVLSRSVTDSSNNVVTLSHNWLFIHQNTDTQFKVS
jgi:hypothetical protein